MSQDSPSDEGKTREQLLSELNELRARTAVLKGLEARSKLAAGSPGMPTDERKQVEMYNEALNRINGTISSTLQFDEIMRSFLSETVKVVRTDMATITMVEDGKLVVKYGYGVPEGLIGSTYNIEGAKSFNLVRLTMKPLVVNDAANDSRTSYERLKEFNIGSYAIFPLTVKDEIIGVFGILNRNPGAFSEAQIGFIEKLLFSLSQAISNARLFEQLQRELAEWKKTEHALQDVNNYFESLINCANAPIIVWDPTFRITRFNHAFEHLTGYGSDEAIGKDLKILFPDNSRDESLVKIRRTLSGEYWESVEIPILRKDGRIRIALWNSANIHGEDGKMLLATIAQGQDITERKHVENALRESERRFKVLTESNIIGIITANTRGFIEANDVFLNMVGYTRDELVKGAVDWQMMTPPEFSLQDELALEELKNSGSFTPYEKEYIRKDGSRVPILIGGALLEREPLTRVCFVLDMTETKRAEMVMKEAKSQAELYLDLMCHDINNMHQVALGYLELARDIMQIDEKDKEFLDRPLDVLQRSARLIDNVRKLQKLQQGVFKAEPVDVCQVLRDVEREYKAVPNKTIILNYNGYEHCDVLANELLHDVFSNLVSNAIKHSSAVHASISINLERVRKNGDQYYKISVEDNGPGIPDDFKDKIFNRMLRGTTTSKGMGLGLYLVKTLTESYNGKVWVEDRVPGDHTRGARFVVMLPAGDPVSS